MLAEATELHEQLGLERPRDAPDVPAPGANEERRVARRVEEALDEIGVDGGVQGRVTRGERGGGDEAGAGFEVHACALSWFVRGCRVPEPGDVSPVLWETIGVLFGSCDDAETERNRHHEFERTPRAPARLRTMPDALRLALFFAAWSGRTRALHRERFIDLEVASRSMRVRCTEPVGARASVAPLVVFAHGMSLLAERDPRQDAFCEALAAAGFRVLAPRIDEVAALRFGSGSVDAIEAIVGAAITHPALGAPGHAAVASVSFSAAATLIAAARPSLRDRVSAALVLGGYADVRLCVRQLLTTAEDDYGRLLGLKNFLRFAGEDTPEIDAAILSMCEDNVAGRPPSTRAERLVGLPEEDARALGRLLASAEAREELLQRAWAKTPELWDLLDLAPAIPSIAFPVAIVHGAGDAVIDVEHAHLLAAWLRARGCPHRLCVTPLIDHGTRRGLFDEGFAAVDVGRTVTFFMRAALGA
jgi:dienelactone hydrolase